MSEAYRDGYEAGRAGNGSCPYKIGTTQYSEWQLGYTRGCQDREVNQ